ncbi:hypothetical protein H6501_00605 [Candidatus Woesearchaeota archaeon]|nr:hypothetical protein [Nanoarchaeota archaeon]MCB9370080.1 hypothetical protein [Candidatus Woesearchaeota archaeon]USN44611.1 MAG: hypothetical protein H6500_02080 [Candidatus Woesearchaeota archaeon]
MEIVEKKDDTTSVSLVLGSDELSLFLVVKHYLEQIPEVDIVGIARDHHLLDRSELHIKVSKGKALDALKKALKEATKDLKSRKL